MRKWIFVTAPLLVVVLMSTAGSVLSTQQQIRRYLNLDASVGVVPDHVQRAILEHVPIGSFENQVKLFLSEHKIGADGGSVCNEHRALGKLDCKLGIDHHSWELLRNTYWIEFEFDSFGKLRRVSSKSEVSWL